MPNNAFQRAEYDKVNSTYRQTIHFINGKTIDGYSKRIGFAESVDPINCLTNFVLRMYIKGYLRPCPEIDPVDFVDYRYNHSNEPIMSCYYEYPTFNPAVIEAHPRLVQWVGQFYEDLQKELPLEQMQAKYHRRGRVGSVYELDINHTAFVKPDHLVRKVLRLIKEGIHPTAHIAQFYRQCMAKYFPRLEAAQVQRYNSILDKFFK